MNHRTDMESFAGLSYAEIDRQPFKTDTCSRCGGATKFNRPDNTLCANCKFDNLLELIEQGNEGKRT